MECKFLYKFQKGDKGPPLKGTSQWKGRECVVFYRYYLPASCINYLPEDVIALSKAVFTRQNGFLTLGIETAVLSV